MSASVELYTFAISHFSEKVRWALDLEGILYEEKQLLPGLHPLTIRRWASKQTVPLLRYGAGDTIQGSTEILRALPRVFGAIRLQPSASISAACDDLETLADAAFGKGLQRIAYGELLQHRERMIELWSTGRGSWAKAFYAVTYPIMAAGVRQLYKPFPVQIERAKQSFRQALAKTDQLLSCNAFLLGDELSRADISVAALIAPWLSPPEHAVKFSPLPEALATFADEFKDGPTARHVFRMYREHRLPRTSGE